MRVLDDFVCMNEECEQYGQVMEDVFHKRGDAVNCGICDQPMKKKLHTFPTHVSWSTWQIGVGKGNGRH